MSKFWQNVDFFNLIKAGIYVEYPSINSICTRFEGHRRNKPKLGRITVVIENQSPSDLDGHGPLTSYTIPSKSLPIYMFVPNMVTVGQICHELSCRQAHFGTLLSVKVPNYLDGHGPLTPFTIPSKSFPRYIFVPNLVTLGQICHELSCRQAHFGVHLSVKVPNDLEGQGQSLKFHKQSH